jgi:ABC-2 type transport system permease protein
MRAVWAVYKRETSLFFRSTIAYAISFALLLFLGILFSTMVSQVNLQNQDPYAQQLVAGDEIIKEILGILTSLMFVIAPLLTMRLLSEEAREGTIEVLLTLPMSEGAFVVGKFLAAWTFYTFVLLLTGVYVLLLLAINVRPDAGLTFSIYLGAWLYGGAVLAVTLIWSAVTEDQIVAAFLGAASVLVLLFADQVAALVRDQPSLAPVSNFVRELTLNAHYQNVLLRTGVLRAEDVAYFILLMIACLFVTTIIVGTRRWRAN